MFVPHTCRRCVLLYALFPSIVTLQRWIRWTMPCAWTSRKSGCVFVLLMYHLSCASLCVLRARLWLVCLSFGFIVSRYWITVRTTYCIARHAVSFHILKMILDWSVCVCVPRKNVIKKRTRHNGKQCSQSMKAEAFFLLNQMLKDEIESSIFPNIEAESVNV